ncbi:MAG: tRNA pseudouridine(38-40) synthase TruA [Nitrospinaceae bacterium]|nr:tRNA pseudouridine(38-40) synthase TruA [Nitrospinaceae bacterium]NIR56262.1 tRNA pseudouridine(38-40) synthase TruA [Nitrospinaceae bacterium]NIS86718.1 tRNA pseudouridine(38-40) synthase TruA [Nitrospinaceae bacterium]NIT83551.1 tRNA pseudouridine(38-40) synthase TruA [Nitrospinaceae bacterium]NIU45756.1 tRNA pseudouridine(38-40) synthase TruA [Nitrospinaceae bacterium]
MRKLKILLEYEGTRYNGWQIQPNGLGIQEILETKLAKITRKPTRVIGSGRTDSGVHAEGQVAHFMTASAMKPREFLKALNSLLPPDIVVKKVEEAGPDFHAQRSATRKTYRYTILNRDYPSALRCRQAHYMNTPLSVTAMRKAARCLVGRKDFKSFQGSGCSAKTTVRDIYRLSISKKDDFITITVDGSGFLKFMVRNIVGTLIEIGWGKWPPEQMKAILKARNRRRAGPTAPARGLCLVKVVYGKKSSRKKAKRR